MQDAVCFHPTDLSSPAQPSKAAFPSDRDRRFAPIDVHELPLRPRDGQRMANARRAAAVGAGPL